MTMHLASLIRLIGMTVALASLPSQPAQALTKEQAIENCRNSVGRPIVQACVKSGGELEACRNQAKPRVQACVVSALNAANARANVAVPLPKDQGPGKDIAKRAAELPTSFVAPPRTINDITAILDGEKPDPAKLRKLKAEAEEAAPRGGSPTDLARFYYRRGTARASLGQLKESIADAELATSLARKSGDANLVGRTEQFLGLRYIANGDMKRALAIFQQQARTSNVPGSKGYLFGAYRQIGAIMIQLGDVAQAEGYLRRSTALINEARTSGLPGWRAAYANAGQSWESDIEFGRALVLEARGRYAEAEQAYRMAEARRRASIPGLMKVPNPPPVGQLQQAADMMVIGQARMKSRQGRFAEAEAEARRALIARLKDQGKYNPVTPPYIVALANILIEQGRYGDAEKLIRVAIEIARTVGMPDESQNTAQMLSHLANVLTLQHKEEEAAATYAELDKAMANWDAARREALDLNGSRIFSLYASGQVDRGIAAAQALVKRSTARLGEQAYDTATARGVLAIGYMRATGTATRSANFAPRSPC
jgi:tetratricopeptide (TPR) repeat protein